MQDLQQLKIQHKRRHFQKKSPLLFRSPVKSGILLPGNYSCLVFNFNFIVKIKYNFRMFRIFNVMNEALLEENHYNIILMSSVFSSSDWNVKCLHAFSGIIQNELMRNEQYQLRTIKQLSLFISLFLILTCQGIARRCASIRFPLWHIYILFAVTKTLIRKLQSCIANFPPHKW